MFRGLMTEFRLPRPGKGSFARRPYRPAFEALEERTLLSAFPVDIAPGSASSDPDRLTAVGNKLFFTANDGSNGQELWVLDAAGPHFLLPNRGGIAAGSASSDPKNLTAVGNQLYFTADDHETGLQLYRTDGTNFEQITAFAQGATFGELCNVNGMLYFSASDGNQVRTGLYRVEGAAPTLVKDFTPSVAYTPRLPGQLTAVGNRVYFVYIIDNYIATYQDLWRSDGTATSTVALPVSGQVDTLRINRLTAVGQYLFFHADDGSVHSTDLWRTNGDPNDPNGTRIAWTIDHPGQFHYVDGLLYFTAPQQSSTRALFVTNAEGTIQSLVANTDGQDPQFLRDVNGVLFYSGNAAGSGRETWLATQSSATLVADLAAGSSNPQEFTAVNGKVYLTADDGTNGRRVWAVDGTGGNAHIIHGRYDNIPNHDSFPERAHLTLVGNTAYFVAAGTGAEGQSVGTELWRVASDAPNSAPVTREYSTTTTSNSFLYILVSALASDPNGDPLTITGTNSSWAQRTYNGTQLQFSPPEGASGTYRFTCTITDGLATATTTVTITVIPPPPITTGLANASPRVQEAYGICVIARGLSLQLQRKKPPLDAKEAGRILKTLEQLHFRMATLRLLRDETDTNFTHFGQFFSRLQADIVLRANQIIKRDQEATRGLRKKLREAMTEAATEAAADGVPLIKMVKTQVDQGIKALEGLAGK